MTKLHTYRHSSPRGGARLRTGLLWLAILLGPLTLTACDLGNLFHVGGEGRLADPVAGPVVEPTSEDIQAIQRALADLGYAPGPADGKAGSRTASAIRQYQTRAGLPVDGEVTLALLESLKTNPVAAPPRPERTDTADHLPPPDVGREVVKDDVVIDSKDDELAPLYEIGDVFAWSDGMVETVVRMGGDRIFWRSSDGSSFNADRNFVLPPSSWDDAAGPGNAKSSVGSGKLWPLPGLREKFQVSTAGPAGGEAVHDWSCSFQGRKKLTVPAGTFDTLVLTCERGQAADGDWRYRTWFYAPAVRHYVRRVDTFVDGTTRPIGLVAIRPGGKGWPAAARAGLDWAIQDALNEQPVGSSAEWGSTSLRANFRIMPTGSRDAVGGQDCRTFVLVRQFGEDRRSYPAISCKDGETGTWLVPVLDKGAVPAGAVVAATP